MKSLFIFLALVFAANSLTAQLTKLNTRNYITIGKVNYMGSLRSELKYAVEEGDTLYMILYRNDEYSHIASYESISFAETGGTLDALYKAMKEAVDAPKKTKSSFQLGDERITLYTDRLSGMKYVSIMTEKGYFNIMPGQIDKLFGKK